MKTRIKLAMIGALGVLTTAANFAQPLPGEDSPQPGTPRGRPDSERPGPEAHRKVLLERYDANKDGKLDDMELTALGKDVFEGNLPPPGRRGPRFAPPRDVRPDGPAFGPPRQSGPRGPREGDVPRPRPRPTLDRGDFDRDGGPPRPRFGPDPRGFGRPDSEQGREMIETHRREFLKQYDTNGDGKLDSAEREQIGKDIENGKLPPPPLPPPARREMPPRE